MNALEIIATLKRQKVVPRLDGDQLKLTGDTGSLSKELIEHIKAAKQELITFLKSTMDQLRAAPILPIPQQEHYAASNAQRRIWLLSQLEGGAAAYNIVTSLYLKGTVIAAHLNKAFQEAIRRHESLRTVFIVNDGEPRQVICEHMPFEISFEDLQGTPRLKNHLQAVVEQLSDWPFDLATGPLLKVDLLRISPDEHAMVFAVHHIISDGWSIGVLVQEVMRLYENYCKATAPHQEPLQIHYKDYTQWLEQRIQSERGQQAREFWQAQFPDIPDPLELPTDFSRPAVKSFDGAVAKFYIPPALHSAIQEHCRAGNTTPFNFFRTTLNILLHKYSGQETIVIGTPVSGRNHADLENQVGLYVNTIPLRASVHAADSFRELLQQTAEHSFRAFEFQDYPLDRIIEDLHVRRDTSRNPLFDVMMVLQNTALGDGTINISRQYGFELQLLDKYLYPGGRTADGKRPAKFDLNFNFDTEPGNRFYLEIEYATWLFKRATITQLYETYLYLIEQVLAAPDITVSALRMLTPHQQEQLLQQFGRPSDAVETRSIPALLAPAFERYAAHTALITRTASLSYAALESRAARTAAHLQPLLRDGNRFAGLLLERTEWMLISILGILKAGGAYVPVDTRYPAARINYILSDAQPACLIVDDTGAALVPDHYTGTVLHIRELMALPDNAPGINADEQDHRESTAYLIYTSGSTGQPKGVDICHRNTIAFLQWAADEFQHTPFEIAYAVTSYCFDLSVFEFFFPLTQGKTIRLLDNALDIPAYAATDRNVLINTVPSVVRSLLEEGMDWQHITALNMAGEPVPKKLKQELDFARMEVRNLYGPSEDTTYSTSYRFEQDDYPTVPIGTPIANTQLYILDPSGQLQPPGVDGEIYLSGQGIAKGYFNQPTLTDTRFLQNPFLPGTIMYKTGDIGRWLPDGKVLFTGRIDDQVKVRGYRIETGEIQYLLEQHPAVEEAVVTVRKIDGAHQLAAYWVTRQSVSGTDLKTFLAERLPAYMIPDYWTPLETIPLNSNGKVDKKQLPDPVAGLVTTTALVPPSTPLQHELAAIWRDVLHLPAVGVTHNFFDIGGHSLKAARLRALIASVLEKEISLNEIFRYPTIEQQAALMATKSRTAAISIAPAPVLPAYPISFSQERLWVLTSFEDASRAYHMPAAFHVEGALDIPLLETAIRQVMARHEILRTVFREQDGYPVQVVLDDMPFRIDTVTIDTPFTREEEQRYLQQQWRTVFDLGNGPLLSCFILQTPHGRILSFNMHHIISDGWSVTVLFRDVMTVYRSLADGKPAHLTPLPLQYKDYTVWQRDLLNGPQIAAARDFWTGMFREPVVPLELPFDFHRPEVKTYTGAVMDVPFKPALFRKITEMGKRNGVSLFMTLMAGVNVLLKKYSNSNDIVTGTPVAGRELQQLHDQIGFYVNTLAIRTPIDPQSSFDDLLQQQREILLAAFEHQLFPFEMLVESLPLKRDLSRSPLFDVMVVLQNIEGLERGGMQHITPDLRLERLSFSAGIAKYDLTFNFAEEDDSLLLSLEYNTDLFSAATVRRMAQHLQLLLEQVTADPQVRIRDIVLADSRDTASQNDRTGVGYDHDATIVRLFENAARRFPDHIALEAGQQRLTYRELDTRSGQLARLLAEQYNVQPETLVLLHMERSEWMIIAILAVLKAGGAYVPVDPDYPEARIHYLLEDSGSPLLLFDTPPAAGIAGRWTDKHFVDVRNAGYTGEPLTAAVTATQAAYVIYTSGTTGQPKGVVITHRNVARLLFNEQPLFDFNEHDRWSLFHSYCFDFSVWEMYGALLYGGTVVIVPKPVAQQSMDFYDFMREQQITVLNQTPTAFRSLVQQNATRFAVSPLAVRYLIFGGEALLPALLQEWHAAMPACKNINMYGITETTVHVTYKEITATEINANRSNIGVPIPTLSCHVLDTDLCPVPTGVTGELCVGGAGVARGYLNRPALTAEKFVEHPFKPGERLYRSGDYARILPSGDMEYIGRKDDQVKIRGHRIEIAEVEAGIIRQEGVKDAVVAVRKDNAGEQELIAWYIADENFPDLQLHAVLNRALPAYMVPSYLIALDAFPLNSNGKLDKSALPAPSASTARNTAFVPCRNDIDREIVAIWETILEKEGIGIRDNFFDLGGHSLKATRVISKINEVFGIRIDLKNLFIDPTVEHLSNYIDTVRWMENKDTVLTEGQDEMIF